VHRLDRDTSGVIVIAKRRAVASALGKLFATRNVKKTYWAVVKGVPHPMQGRIDVAHVRLNDVFAVWQKLAEHGLAAANYGLAGDIIACPGLDYCSLANARSIPIAQEITRRFANPRHG
jgi:NAD(P)H-nitrite reductase large subunit